MSSQPHDPSALTPERNSLYPLVRALGRVES